MIVNIILVTILVFVTAIFITVLKRDYERAQKGEKSIFFEVDESKITGKKNQRRNRK